jgi:hypothetical protein
MLIPASAAMNMHSFDKQDKDLAPICSGNGEIKWIKLSEFYKTGKITFLEQASVDDSSEQNNNIDNTCSTCSIYNQLDNHAIELNGFSLILNNLASEVVISSSRHFTEASVLTPSSRDPPSLM